MGREFELKYKATPDVLQSIEAAFQGFTSIVMETAYFDTPDSALRSRKWMLRRRLENGRSVCTLKTPLPDGSRGEWETECAQIIDAIPALLLQGAPIELEQLVKPGLIPVCAARFTRKAAAVALNDTVVELALDQGVLLGGEQELPLCELEVELKSGAEDTAVSFAKALSAQYCLQQEPLSKVQRAMSLIK